MSRARISGEIAIVLALSLGMSGLYALVTFARRLSQEAALNEQTATINRPLAEEPLFDLAYQLLGIASALAPVALVLYLVARPISPRFADLGLDGSRKLRDTAWGIICAASIGIPGLALYYFGVQWGLTVQIVPSALEAYWWTIPVLLLRALTAGIVEETIAVGYLSHRLSALALSPWLIILSQALLRGVYHLYQGVGPFIGNVVMGVVFGLYYLRTRRLAPLIIGHALIDAVAFVGYPLVSENFPEILGFTQ